MFFLTGFKNYKYKDDKKTKNVVNNIIYKLLFLNYFFLEILKSKSRI